MLHRKKAFNQWSFETSTLNDLLLVFWIQLNLQSKIN